MQATTALKKIASLRSKIRVVQGGQGAGKTISILMLLINHASSNEDREIFIVSAELTKMRLTVIKDFVKVMKSFGIYDESRFSAGTLYRFPNGSFIKFIGLDKEDVGKGLRSDVVYFNEANKVDFESYREMASRAKLIYIDYNPNAEFWVHSEILTREDHDFLVLTFQDNEFLDQEEKKEILLYRERGFDENGNEVNKYWANKWRVYGLGQVSHVEGVIFTNWQEGETPKHLPVVYGMDFGYVHDPTTLVRVARKDSNIYVHEILYAKELSTEQIAKVIKDNTEKDQLIVADSAEPRLIDELYYKDINIVKCRKGRDSVRFGIQKLLESNIIVTPTSDNLIRELRNYTWGDKKSNTPIDGWDHCIDAIRYANEELDYMGY